MTRALIISDSHGGKQAVKNIIAAASALSPDMIIHLGDGFSDARAIGSALKIPVLCVCGNCDFMAGTEQAVVDIGGVRALACHGHRYHVKSGLGALEAAAIGLGCKAALFGHTHVPLVQQRESVLMLNPGAAGGYPGTYLLLEADGGEIMTAEVFPLGALPQAPQGDKPP